MAGRPGFPIHPARPGRLAEARLIPAGASQIGVPARLTGPADSGLLRIRDQAPNVA